MLALLAPPPAPGLAGLDQNAGLRQAVAAIERTHGERLGVSFLDTKPGAWPPPNPSVRPSELA